MEEIAPLLPGFLFLLAVAVGMVALFRRVSAENREKEERRKDFVSSRGWRYSSEGYREYKISPATNSPYTWAITVSLGEDTSTTTWCAPHLKSPRPLFLLKSKSRSPQLTAQQKEIVYGFLNSPFVGSMGKIITQESRLQEQEFPFERTSVRDTFSVSIEDASTACSLVTPHLEVLLARWLDHPQIPRPLRETLEMKVGPSGACVTVACVAEEPETIEMLADLGSTLATAYRNTPISRER